MALPFLYFVAGVVEQIVDIKFQLQGFGKKIAEIALPQIYGIAEIKTVIPKIQQHHKFFMGKQLKQMGMIQRNGGIV